MEILGVPIYDDDLIKLLQRFLINLFFIFIIIRIVYYSKYRRKDYLFTYFMVGFIVFFICFTLKKFELDIGMALGLFAIFGILRYRTNQIEIREMTYLFIVIGVSVINALANKKMSYAELMFTNVAILSFTWILEKFWLLKNELSKKIVYEKIENIKPNKQQDLKQDLEERTGIAINRVEINDVDFLKDIAHITIYYYATDQKVIVK